MLQEKALIGVYAIVNVISKDFYIGSTFAKDGITGRLNRHFWLLRSNKHGNKFMQNSFNKYGEDAFICFPVEIVDEAKDARSREKFWFNKLQPSFNLIEVGDGEEIYSDETRSKLAKPFQNYNASLKGKQASEKRKAQLEEARKKYREQGVSQETRDKLSKSASGKKFSDEWKKNIGKSRKGKPSPMKGKHFSDEAISNMSAAQKARNYHPSKETREKMSIKNFSDDGRKRISEASKKRWEKFRLEKQQQRDNPAS